jgi:ribonuclease III
VAVRNPLVAPDQVDPLSAAPRGGETAAEAIVGHVFTRKALLREALTHRSAVIGRRLARGRTAPAPTTGSNERLEFIGDRVLGLLIAEWLAERFPEEPEGALGPRLGRLVSQPVLAEIATHLGLPDVLAVGAGESRAGVRTLATVLSDAMEALIGAIYLDAGLEPARAFVRRAWDEALEADLDPPKDPKTALQEWVQARGHGLPDYHVVSREGPSHDPVFVVAVEAAGARGEGRAGSKRAAERLAAENLLAHLTHGKAS